MRFQVDQEVPFIALRFNNEPYAPLYVPWLHTLDGIDIKVMRCASHHRVRWQWEEESVEPTHDGFIFEDESGRQWHNHYPYYTGGQISDEMLYRVEPAEPSDEELFLTMEAGAPFLERIQRGMRSEGLTLEQKALLQKHYREVVEKLAELGWVATVRSRVVRFTDGRPSRVDPIHPRVKLTKKGKDPAELDPVQIYYWRDGRMSVIRSKDVSSGFSKLGYGGGAISALDFYQRGQTLWAWSVSERNWCTLQPKAVFDQKADEAHVREMARLHRTTAVQLDDGSAIELTTEGTPYYTVRHVRTSEGEFVDLIEPWLFHLSDFEHAFKAFWDHVQQPYARKEEPAVAVSMEEIESRLEQGFSWDPKRPS